VVLPLASWELGRDPLPRARLALLLVLATGLGAYATVYDATLRTSAQQRAAFQVGADARRDLVNGPLTGTTASPVWRGQLILGEGVAPVSTLGVDPPVFANVLAWPTDGSYRPMIQGLSTNDETAGTGLVLPGGARQVSFGLAVTPDADLLVPLPAPGRIVARVVDDNGGLTNVATSPFAANGDPVTTTLTLPAGAKQTDALVLDPPD